MDLYSRSLMIIALFSVSCTPPDYRSSFGVSYYWNGSQFDTNQIEEQEKYFVEQISSIGSYQKQDIINSMSKISVFVYPDKIPCSFSQSGYCNGFEDYNYLYVRNIGCIFNSALMHEMAHWLQLDIHKFTDYDHTEFLIWEIADSVIQKCQ